MVRLQSKFTTEPQASAVARQHRYARVAHHRGKLGLAIPEAFVRGIRQIGYRTNVEAIAELVDNSIQAYAERVDIVFGYDSLISSKKPAALAVVDDGHGMGAAMLRLAMMWGGTHRENDRSGLGRYGYGLPCATVSIGRRFTIFSRTKGKQLHQVSLDLDALDAGDYLDRNGDVILPEAQPGRLPEFLEEHLLTTYPKGWKSGTIVLVEKLDRLDWTTASGLRGNISRSFGATYHKLLWATSIYVGGERVTPIDPLFLTPDRALYDLDPDRARALDPISFRLSTSNGEGEITLRYSWLPPSFGAIDKGRDAVGLNANARFPIIKHYHGVIFSRNGRIIDVLSRTPWTTFVNNDRYIRIEVEFSASLDEMFGVTTSKQQISVSPEIWDRLREAGLHKAIEHLRAKVRAAKARRDKRNGARPAHQRAQTASTVASGSPNAVQREPVVLPTLLQRGVAPLSLKLNAAHPLFTQSGSHQAKNLGFALEALIERIGARALNANDPSSGVCRNLLLEWASVVAPGVTLPTTIFEG